MDILSFLMEYKTNGSEEIDGIFRELSLENQSLLLECSQISQIAENAVKKAFSDRHFFDATNSGDLEKAIHKGGIV
jgi:hypothetical protein